MTPEEALAALNAAEQASTEATARARRIVADAKREEWQALDDLRTATGSQQAAAHLLGTTQQAVQKRLAKLRREATYS